MIGSLFAQATAEKVDLTIPFIAGGALWLVFGAAGAAMARSRNSSMLLGAAMSLLCGILGLYFVTKLPSRDGLPARKRRGSLLPPDGSDEPRPIDPEIAKKLGLPPQRTADGHPTAPPTAPPQGVTVPPFQPGVAPPSFQPGAAPAQPSFEPGAAPAPPSLPTLPSFGSFSQSPVAPVPPVAPPLPPVTPTVPVSVPGPVPVPVAGYWAVDPSGRFAHRWWDGARWTARVIGPDGIESIDPSV